MQADDPEIKKMFYNTYKYFIETYRDHDLDYSFHAALPIDDSDYLAYDSEAYEFAKKEIEEYLRSPVYASA